MHRPLHKKSPNSETKEEQQPKANAAQHIMSSVKESSGGICFFNTIKYSVAKYLENTLSGSYLCLQEYDLCLYILYHFDDSPATLASPASLNHLKCLGSVVVCVSWTTGSFFGGLVP